MAAAAIKSDRTAIMARACFSRRTLRRLSVKHFVVLIVFVVGSKVHLRCCVYTTLKDVTPVNVNKIKRKKYKQNTERPRERTSAKKKDWFLCRFRGQQLVAQLYYANGNL